MMPYEPVRDIMRRTMLNLKFINKHKGDNGPYEVTQLINSFLGALAHPWETYKCELNEKSLADAHRAGWPTVYKEKPNDYEPTSLGDLIRLMRNALAHGHVKFGSRGSGKIQTLHLWNTVPNTDNKRTWGTIITVNNMETFLGCFVALAEELHDKESKARPQRKAS